MERVLATEGEGEARFVGLLNALRDVYEENRIYLKPLVIDYHSSMFSRAYRQMLKDALKKDGNFPAYPENSWTPALFPWRKLSGWPTTLWSTEQNPLY